jgi:hypothetical protein
MADHKLDEGKKVIAVMAELGVALGYSVRTEMPVEQRAKAPAVDVAWFAEGEQKYPLMIFEVESSATNSMANNPTKVFGQPSTVFERPLFFFHIVVSSGAESTRIENLRGVFGVHNYRVYPLDRSTATQLVCDVLDQHRRIRREISVGPMMDVLLRSPSLHTNKLQILEHASETALSGHYLRDLAILACIHTPAEDLFLAQLRDRIWLMKWPETDLGYDTWLGMQWAVPIHLGLLFLNYPADRAALLGRLRWWHEKSSYASQIGPHFALSRDYDIFVIGASGAYLALIAVLMLEDTAAVEYIALQVLQIVLALEKQERRAWLHSVAWTLHIAASVSAKEYFETCRAFANARGGLPVDALYRPPAFVSVDSLDEDPYEGIPGYDVPTLEEFKMMLTQATATATESEKLRLALIALTREEHPFVDASALVVLLSRRTI